MLKVQARTKSSLRREGEEEQFSKTERKKFQPPAYSVSRQLRSWQWLDLNFSASASQKLREKLSLVDLR